MKDITKYAGGGTQYQDEQVSTKKAAERLSLPLAAIRLILRRCPEIPKVRERDGYHFNLGHIERFLDAYGYGHDYPSKDDDWRKHGVKGPGVWIA